MSYQTFDFIHSKKYKSTIKEYRQHMWGKDRNLINKCHQLQRNVHTWDLKARERFITNCDTHFYLLWCVFVFCCFFPFKSTGPVTVPMHFYCMKKSSLYIQLNFLCSIEERTSCRFRVIWGWVIDYRMLFFFFGWTVPLRREGSHQRVQQRNTGHSAAKRNKQRSEAFTQKMDPQQ